MNDMKELARAALQVQDAVNLRGVLLAWHKAACEVGPNWRHPINILYMSKVASLMGVRSDSIGGVWEGTAGEDDYKDLFRSAYAWACDVTREPYVPEAVIQSVASWARTEELFQSTLKELRYHAGDNFWSFTTAGMFVGIEPDGYMHT